MIEVEAKCLLSQQTKEALLKNAILQKQKTFVVEFWDNAEWKLGLKNFTLKKKDGKFELKVANTPNNGSSFTASMNELTEDASIYQALELTPKTDLESDLRDNGYQPKAIINVSRTTYVKDGFILDLDSATFPLLKTNTVMHYEIAEIELQLASESEIEQANKRIVEFAQKHGIHISNTRGKYLEFLYQNYPEHYKNLVKIGVIDK